MNLANALDRAFGLVVVPKFFSEATDAYLPRSVWTTMDDDLLSRLAFTKKANVRLQVLQKIVGKFKKEGDNLIYIPGEEDDERIAQMVARSMEGKATPADEEELVGIRKEARAWANERGINPPKYLDASDPLAMTPDQREKAREEFKKRKETEVTAPKKEYYGDKLYRVEDHDGNVVRDGFPDNAEAERWILRNFSHAEKDQFKIEIYDNPKSLSALNTVVKPLDKGWTKEEIINAMKPMVRYFANKYWSAKVGIEDLVQDGYVGVLRALETDKGIAPFGKYAPQKIKNEILRAALQKGLIRGPEDKASGASLGEKGPIVSYDVVWYDKDNQLASMSFAADISAFKNYYSEKGISPPLKMDPNYLKAQEFKKGLLAQGLKPVANGILVTRSKMGSLDKPIGGKGDGESTGRDYVRGRIATPAHQAATKNMISHLFDASKLSDKQKEALRLTFAMDVPEGSMSYFPKQRPGQPADPEQVTAAADPIKVQGMADRTIARTSADSDFSRRFSKSDPKKKGFSIERGPVEVAKMMGISTERARQLLQAGLDKMLLAAQREQMDTDTIDALMGEKEKAEAEAERATKERSKKMFAGVPAQGSTASWDTGTKAYPEKEFDAEPEESLNRLDQLIMFEEVCRSMILELAITGNLILG